MNKALLDTDILSEIIAALALNHGLEFGHRQCFHFQRVQQIGYNLTLANWRISPDPLASEISAERFCDEEWVYSTDSDADTRPTQNRDHIHAAS